MAQKMNTQEYATAANLNYKYGNEFFYPSDISLDTFEEMKERDETIASTLDVFVASILNMIGEYQSEDDAIADFIRNRFNLENKSIRSVLTEVLTDSLAFGFGVAEEIWDVVNMQVTVQFRRVNPARPTYARFVADESDITAVRFWSTKG